MDEKYIDLKEFDVDKDTKTITYSYKSSNSLEAVKMLVQTHIMQWGRSPEFLVVDDVTLAMLKANLFNLIDEEQYYDPAYEFEKMMDMTIVNKNNSIIFTQDSIKFVKREDKDEGTDT